MAAAAPGKQHRLFRALVALFGLMITLLFAPVVVSGAGQGEGFITWEDLATCLVRGGAPPRLAGRSALAGKYGGGDGDGDDDSGVAGRDGALEDGAGRRGHGARRQRAARQDPHQARRLQGEGDCADHEAVRVADRHGDARGARGTRGRPTWTRPGTRSAPSTPPPSPSKPTTSAPATSPSRTQAPAAPPGAVGQQAVALRLSGDKIMLYRCRILGAQDTLFDNIGRYYLYNCDIQGSIDFIFRNARFLYQGCRLHAVATSYGAIAASQRSSATEESGFSFVGCRLTCSGMLYLGRAWGKYARVVYSFCDLSGIVVPQGWSDWGDRARTKTVLFGEYNCKGPGASSRERVPWSRALTYQEALPFLGRDFINGDQWLRL